LPKIAWGKAVNRQSFIFSVVGVFTMLSVMFSAPAIADPMYDAVQEGVIEQVKSLVEAGADISAKGILGHPPLNHAAASGHKDIAEYLISKGADVNGRDQDGSSPLQTAAFWGSKEICIILISSGANINSKDKFGLTPLHATAGGGYSQDFSMNITLAGMAAGMSFDDEKAKNFKDISEILISKGADVNVKSGNDYTPLHFAAEFGRTSVAEILISKGADINSSAGGGFFKKGKTPLGLAVKADHKEVIDLLRQHGAQE
jgi:ankyrin repeat protein